MVECLLQTILELAVGKKGIGIAWSLAFKDVILVEIVQT